jgi:hypothetical protein
VNRHFLIPALPYSLHPYLRQSKYLYWFELLEINLDGPMRKRKEYYDNAVKVQMVLVAWLAFFEK